MKINTKNNIFINPFFDAWCILAVLVLYILMSFMLLIITAMFFNLNWIIPIVYLFFPVLPILIPFFTAEPRISRIILTSESDNGCSFLCQDGLHFYRLKTDKTNFARILINIAPWHMKGVTTIYTTATVFINSMLDEKQREYIKSTNKIVIEDKYNNRNIERLISLLKNYSSFSYEIKTSEDYKENCEKIKNEIINYIENNQPTHILTKNLKKTSIIGCLFSYLLFGFIIFSTLLIFNLL